MRVLDALEEWIISTLMAAATLVIFVAVLHRYLVGVPALQDMMLRFDFTWAQELCIYLFVWMAKFGAAYGVRTGIHVGVDVVINRLDSPLRARFIVFGLLAGALFTGVVGSLGANFVYHIAQTEQVSADLEAPMWLVYLAIPLGSFLMSFRFLQVCVAFRRTGSLPHHDHGHVEGLDSGADEAADINWYALDDGLHPHDLAHPSQSDRKPGTKPGSGRPQENAR
ncbi:TRAP transporter small permease [Azospirillum griseum]|uniref:TRAP transporter small permease protein n=1 Tax=Azospirillum griseum TaxID=2496639 RepID=A0A431VD46_9PROT|nr:TRAP transporter small permease [Azospirillum griseum]RTR17063.1 TRAP transporter small permease [Azospirillum griseum]